MTEFKATHRHRKGGEYMLLTEDAVMQARDWHYRQEGAGSVSSSWETVDMARVAIYVDRDGTHWVRPLQDFQERFRKVSVMDDLDAADIQRAFLAGHLSPMDDTTRMAYADAPAFCLCGEVGDFFVTVGWDPEDADWRCEVYLGDEAALVDLKEGTWERL